MDKLKKILVAEDEHALREDIMEIIAYEGYEAYGAADGAEAVTLAHQHLPDLIICDIMMPEMDGYSVLINLRGDPITAHIPFIFLTARTSRSEMRRGMELGADDYLTKPFTQPELIAAIHARFEKMVIIQQEYERRLNDLRDSVIRALPHELRTPLTGIIGYARMLMEDANELDGAQVYQMADGIDQAARRMYRLTENYLFYAQIELMLADTERVRAVRQHTIPKVKTFVQDVMLRKAHEYNRTGDFHYEGMECALRVSDESLIKIIEEVTDNAFKFSEPDTPVEAISRCDGLQFVLTITNTGRGMTAEQIEKIGAYMQFERRFYEQSGLGLGLAITQRLLQLHNGTFDIASQVNGKTTVTLTLPIAD